MLALKTKFSDPEKISIGHYLSVGGVIFALIFLVSVGLIKQLDVLNDHFDGPVTYYIIYHLLRIIVTFYLGWFTYACGYLVTRIYEIKCGQLSLGILERSLLSFAIGFSLIQILMLALGYCRLFYSEIVVTLMTPMIMLTYHHFKEMWSTLSTTTRSTFAIKRLRRNWSRVVSTFGNPLRLPSLFKHSCITIAVTSVAMLTVVLLIKSGLTPSDSGDLLTHYIPYYVEVIKEHGIWPGSIWYHFWVSKGAGFQFLSILLTDSQGSALASFVACLFTTLIVFSISRISFQTVLSDSIASRELELPLMVTIAFLLAIMAEPSDHFYKHHAITLYCITVMVWFAIWSPSIPQGDSKIWKIIWGLYLVGAVVHAPTMAPILIGFLIILSITSYLFRYPNLTKIFLVPLGFVTITLMTILLTNFLISGAFECSPFRLCFIWSNQKQLSTWVSPYLWKFIDVASSEDFQVGVNKILHVDFFNLVQLFRLNNLKHLFPHLLIFMTIAIVAMLRIVHIPRPRFKTLWPIIPLFSISLVALLLSNQGASHQSIARYYVFMVPVTIVMGGLIYIYAMAWIPRKSHRKTWSCLILLVCISFIPERIYQYRKNISWTLKAKSYANFYFPSAETLTPGRMNFQDVLKIMNIVGNNKVLLMYHENQGLEIVPHLNVTSEINHSLGKDWPLIAFQNPSLAASELKRKGVNYFLFNLNVSPLGCIAYGDLFATQNLKVYFRLLWTNGKFFLVTWQDAGIGEEIPESLVHAWQNCLSMDSYQVQTLCKAVRSCYESNHETFPIPLDCVPSGIKAGWQ